MIKSLDRSSLMKVAFSVSIMLIIAVIILIFFFTSHMQKEVDDPTDQIEDMEQRETKQSGQMNDRSDESDETDETLNLSDIEVDKKCGIGAAINLKKDLCRRIDEDRLSLTLDHAGTDDLPGVKYYVTDVDGSSIIEDIVFETIPGNSTKEIEIDADESFYKIEIRSMIFEDGTYYECLNQRFSIPSRICD